VQIYAKFTDFLEISWVFLLSSFCTYDAMVMIEEPHYMQYGPLKNPITDET